MKLRYDFVIVGSGFGGAITAYRLARAQARSGQSVSICVLERGKRYNLNEFPRSPLRRKDWVWRDGGRRGWKGIFDYRRFDKIDVLVGSGVGGTSLIYLDVQIDAFPTTWDIRDPVTGERRWPSSFDWAGEMPRYYQRVFDMLQPRPIPDPTLKTRALKAAADAAGAGERFHLLDLAIFWGREGSEKGVLHDDPYQRSGPPQYGCGYCGECFLGCNTHSKNTLDLNYLWLAQRQGAEVCSQHHVVAIAPEDGGYRIDYQDLRWKFSGSVWARTLVLAAGALGSTEVLLRSKLGYRSGKREVPPTLPRLADKLGTYFSGNGDFGAVGFETNRIVNPIEGPTITGGVDYRDLLGGHGFIVEDGGFPDLLRANLREVAGGPYFGRRLIRRVAQLLRLGGSGGGADGLLPFLDLKPFRDALPYLVMGIDAADGEMSIDAEGHLQIRWKNRESMPLFREMEARLRELTETPHPGLDGNLMVNPTWSAQKHLVTVHPLGGCPMGDDPTRGVVDPNGRVFHYDNLYVVDGSIVPSALGPNPSKTIGALAEKVSEHLVQKYVMGSSERLAGREVTGARV